MNRRSFVSTLATAGAVAATSPRLFGADAMKPPTIGLIGSGWYGGVNLNSLVKNTGGRVTSLCDVSTKQLSETLDFVAERQSHVPKTFADYNDMLDADVPDIVIVATPDHWHAMPAIAAMRAGADVFVEKPIGVDVVEGEAMVAAARKYDSVVQVNTQRRSYPIFRHVKKEFIQAGRLGEIGQVETYGYVGGGRKGISEVVPVPDYLDYDAWTGPAPMRPFTANKEDRGWRRYQEYGNGIIGDMGVHKIDVARWLLDLGWPTKIYSTGGIRFPEGTDANTPDHQHAILEYPDLTMSWVHRTWGKSPIVNSRHWSDGWGVRITGSKGTLDVTMLHYTFTPNGPGEVETFHELSPDGDPAHADFSGGTKPLEARAEANHAADFMAARASRSRPVADIEEAHISSACCQLANVSLELGRPVSYDPTTRTVRGDAEATALLAREYRTGWKHPDPKTV
ncbi:MAG: Gfo/Idh/MocA family oxidoreductase [Opitutaceae bacterium]|nr:Gfo/Idh/MocA family oxidoreductase [Opitutaceae bacterium]